MTKVINVLMICFESILLKKTFKEEEFEETDEFNESDNDDADKQEQDT